MARFDVLDWASCLPECAEGSGFVRLSEALDLLAGLPEDTEMTGYHPLRPLFDTALAERSRNNLAVTQCRRPQDMEILVHLGEFIEWAESAVAGTNMALSLKTPAYLEAKRAESQSIDEQREIDVLLGRFRNAGITLGDNATMSGRKNKTSRRMDIFEAWCKKNDINLDNEITMRQADVWIELSRIDRRAFQVKTENGAIVPALEQRVIREFFSGAGAKFQRGRPKKY